MCTELSIWLPIYLLGMHSLLVKVLSGLRISHLVLNFKFQKMYLVWTLVQFNEMCLKV